MEDVVGRSVPDALVGLRPEPASSLGHSATITIAEWANTKKQREELRAKFSGRCAYCGCELDKMHADHLEPCVRVTRDAWGKPLPASECYMVKPERNTVANMMPACAPCNLHKGGYSLEGWRDIIQRSAAICRRDTSTFKVGERFGIISAYDKPVKFFFEKCPTCEDREYFPQYGVAPHDCYWRKGPQFTIGQSTLRAIAPEDCFVPDLDEAGGWAGFEYPSACGVYYCSVCQRDEYQRAWDRLVAGFGPPPASVTGTGTAETSQKAQGEACQNGPQGDAQNTPPSSPQAG